MLSKSISADDVTSEKWQSSDTYRDIMSFITDLASSTISVKRKDVPVAAASQAIIDILNQIDHINSQIVISQDVQTRYGHKSFRTFLSEVQRSITSILKEKYPTLEHDVITELEQYLVASLGESTRLDYGTGHELNFVFFMLALYRLNVITREDFQSLALHALYHYLHIVYTIQDKYRLEPAGSQGAFSFDDYNLIGFVVGSFQMRGNEDAIMPNNLQDMNLLTLHAEDYLLLDCFHRTFSVKSMVQIRDMPIIDAFIRAVNWKKASAGMIKFYKDHVLNQFPVVQHCLFGEIIKKP
ncbi:hypothetical protein GEMRC1_003859 [Eukaryota sp. GEM-RC1]